MKDMKNKLVLVMLLGVLLIGIASAVSCGDNSLGTFKQGEVINLRQTCDTCTYVTLSSVIYPDSTIISINTNMTKTGIDYNYTFTNLSNSGGYYYTVFGDKDGNISTETFCFEVTVNGKEGVSQGQSGLYIFILILAIVLCGVSFLFAIKIEGGKYKKDDENKIIGINDLRNLRLGLFFFSYLMLYFDVTILYQLSFTYLDIEGLTGILKWTYLSMTAIIGPILIVTVIVIIINKIADNKTQKALERGIDVKR